MERSCKFSNKEITFLLQYFTSSKILKQVYGIQSRVVRDSRQSWGEDSPFEKVGYACWRI